MYIIAQAYLRCCGVAKTEYYPALAAAILDFKNFKFLTVGTGQHATRPSYPTIRSTDIRVLFYFIVNNSFIY